MKDITLKITGRQKYKDREDEQMEFITDGRLYVRNDAAYIMYDESELSGMEGCTTTIRLKDRSVRMKRIGDNGFGAELYFEEGKRFNSIYSTPYGPMGIEVLTDQVKNDFDVEKGKGSIAVQYQISMEGIAESCNTITINVM